MAFSASNKHESTALSINYGKTCPFALRRDNNACEACTYFILIAAAHDVEEQINIVPIDDRPVVQKDDVARSLVRFVEERFFEFFLFLHGRQRLIVVLKRTITHGKQRTRAIYFGEHSIAVIVENNYALDHVERGHLEASSAGECGASGWTYREVFENHSPSWQRATHGVFISFISSEKKRKRNMTHEFRPLAIRARAKDEHERQLLRCHRKLCGVLCSSHSPNRNRSRGLESNLHRFIPCGCKSLEC